MYWAVLCAFRFKITKKYRINRKEMWILILWYFKGTVSWDSPFNVQYTFVKRFETVPFNVQYTFVKRFWPLPPDSWDCWGVLETYAVCIYTHFRLFINIYTLIFLHIAGEVVKNKNPPDMCSSMTRVRMEVDDWWTPCRSEGQSPHPTHTGKSEFQRQSC